MLHPYSQTSAELVRIFSIRFRLARNISYSVLCASDQLSEVWVPNGLRVLSYPDFPYSFVSLCSSSATTTISWTLVTVSGLATVTGLPELGSSSRLSLPRLNAATHFFTVVYKRASFPSDVISRSFMQILNHRWFSNFVLFAKGMCPGYFTCNPFRHKLTKCHGLLVTKP